MECPAAIKPQHLRPEQLKGCGSTPEQLDAAALVTPQDLAAARGFWAYWGTPLLNAMLNAALEPAEAEASANARRL
jgi:hypothetical protein